VQNNDVMEDGSQKLVCGQSCIAPPSGAPRPMVAGTCVGALGGGAACVLLSPCTARVQGYGHSQVCVEREVSARRGVTPLSRGPRTQNTEHRTEKTDGPGGGSAPFPQSPEPPEHRTQNPQNTEHRTQNPEHRTQNTEGERAKGRCAPLSPTEHGTQNTEPRKPMGSHCACMIQWHPTPLTRRY